LVVALLFAKKFAMKQRSDLCDIWLKLPPVTISLTTQT